MSKKHISITALVFAFLFFFSPNKTTLAQAGPSSLTCGLADISPNTDTYQNWDVTYCVEGSTRQEVVAATQVTGTCRATSVGTPSCECHPEDWYTNPLSAIGARVICGIANGVVNGLPDAATTTQNVGGQFPILQDAASGRYYTCFTLTQINRDVGLLQTEIKNDQGDLICTPPLANVKPGNYSWLEFYDNVLETRFNVDIITDTTERGSDTLRCNTITGKQGVNTAVGCFATDVEGFTKDFLTLAIGVGGSIGLILLLYGFFLIGTSGGNPQKTQSGQQMISAVIQGLALIALSVVLLNFFGINILRIPGLQ